MNKEFEALIIGAGPAGIGAALILKEAGVNFAIIEKDAPGGKVNIAPRVDNYPGQHQIPGPDLAMVFYQRLLDNKVDLISDEIVSLTKEDETFVLEGKYGTYLAKTVLIATGTRERKLGFENEDRLLGHGLSYCALCDGHFFKDKVVAVVGGGNVALKDAIHLSKGVKKLYLIHRRNEFRGDKRLVDEIKNINNIEIVTPYIPLEILDNGKVTGLRIQNREDNSEKTLEIDGIFPLIGQDPNSGFIKIEGVTNESGTIPFNKGMATNITGLYVAGDITPRDIRQIYLAEHDGKVAGRSMIEFLGK